MTNYRKLIAEELANCMIDEEGLKYPQYKMPIYYRYAPYVYNLVVLYYVDECVYLYTSE